MVRHHTMATLMLEHGADIRFIQAMLGPRGAVNDANLHAGVDPQAPETLTATHPAAGTVIGKAGEATLPRRRSCFPS